ncbi:MAG TPA: hypothetical protein VK463_02065 [Desulfomonilaceae bacterium]|nr:hypothetical protein [Desulfomonilaceae bacterium]
MKNYLCYKAGPAILDMIRQEGLRPERIRTFAGPAGGPKWFVSVGFDHMLMRSRILGKGGHRVLLAGSSAGAWRCLAMACADPPAAYEKLRIAYSRNVFTSADTPVTVAAALKGNVDAFLGDIDVDHILNHSVYDLALHTVRAKGPAASENRTIQGAALVAAMLANAASSSAMGLFFERVVFISDPFGHSFIRGFSGTAVQLTKENLRQAALATGSLPYIVAGVPDIFGAPAGVYRDGGLLDYQLNQDYLPSGDGLTLFFHYQERIVPGWFDKKLSWRTPPQGALDRVLQVYPGRDFVRRLPGRKLPDRDDFREFVNDPAERIRRWDEVSALSEILGEEFLEAVESGRIRSLIQPIQ